MNLARLASALLCSLISAGPGTLAIADDGDYSERKASRLADNLPRTESDALLSPIQVQKPEFSNLENLLAKPKTDRHHRTSAGALSRARQLSSEACEHIRALRYDDAEVLLDRALEIAPGLANAHSNLGYLYNKTGRHEQAIPHLEYAASLAPEQPAPLVTLAGAYQLSGQFDKAIPTYRAYLSRFPYAPDREFIKDIVARLSREYSRTSSIKVRGQKNSDDYLSFSNHGAMLSWDKNNLKVYIAPAVGLAGYRPELTQLLKEAFLTWQTAGPITFQFVESKQGCDIECNWVDSTSKLSSPGEGGEAIMSYEGTRLKHCRIFLLTRRAMNETVIDDNEILGLCLHEIGHSLGLAEHSPNPEDIMFCTILSAANRPRLSARDLLTIQRLYSGNKPLLQALK